MEIQTSLRLSHSMKHPKHISKTHPKHIQSTSKTHPKDLNELGSLRDEDPPKIAIDKDPDDLEMLDDETHLRGVESPVFKDGNGKYLSKYTPQS